ncbi:hypothetical protein [Rufibacter tibetensis]|uniref:Uncharacterized protein n=1 Tax=Rufibacter tibetensis TaxID=512763 RepID=A0A0P0CWA0_9BACT|nr:hypothetical protein [Rufibacter tibetensis]ALI99618.1 hypothetical protein DC20_12350 [Rufibacter tibetensis]
MNALRFLLLALVMTCVFKAQAQNAPSDLTDFLKRFQLFEKHHNPKVRDTMPILKPDKGETAAIPNAIKKNRGFMIDPVTRLQHYPQLGKVYDPETGYSISYDPKAEYKIDVQAGKVYKGDMEVKPERRGSSSDKG